MYDEQVEFLHMYSFNVLKPNTVHHTNKMKEEKLYNHISRCRKDISQNPIPNSNKIPSKLELERNLLLSLRTSIKNTSRNPAILAETCIPGLWELRQEDLNFESSLGNLST